MKGPSASGLSNCDTLSPKRNSNVDVMNRWSSDEAIVIVKFGAEEFRVTWRRVKQRISDRMLEVKPSRVHSMHHQCHCSK